jgi:alpha-galactosidase
MIRFNNKSIILLILSLQFQIVSAQSKKPDFYDWAKTPPMGWNSYDCFGAAITENEVKANAKMMEVHLKDAGWEYIVIDYCWFYPFVGALNNPPQTEDFKPSFPMDKFGRLYPAIDRFPSATPETGFKEIGNYIHSLGLKFGIHVMRGIPREAVAKKMPVKGTNFTADQITDYSTCGWLNSMFGVDMEKPGAQEYYNSIFELYAEWGVDFVKVDDISYPYREKEIEGIRKAIDNCGREMVLSLSPGDGTPPDKAEHLKKNANMWRISSDFWDDWGSLLKQFELLKQWQEHIGEGHWPDADMIPIGVLNRRGPGDGLERESNFTTPEKYTLMTLWCIAKSPLMYGGDLTLIRPSDLELLTNTEVIEVNKMSYGNKEHFKNDEMVIWSADIRSSPDKYVAIFNISDTNKEFEINTESFGLNKNFTIRDLWKRSDIYPQDTLMKCFVEAHGAVIYRISEK